MVVELEKEAKPVVLAKPFSLEGDDEHNDYRAPNLLRRISSLFKNVRPGSDLCGLQLPPEFNLPKSQLQCYGESVYCFGGEDLLRKCNAGDSPIRRFKTVVAWCISTLRPLIFGVAPFNPILGETHHVSRGSLNVLLEQVSHHPPVSALHATDEQENIEMIWCHHPVPKFYGTSVETGVKGRRQLKLLNQGETYEMNSPNLLIRFLPVPAVDWVGKVNIRCKETNFEAELHLRPGSFMGFARNNRSIRGKIYESLSKKILYDISGHWDRSVTAKDLENGKVEVIFDAKNVLLEIKTPTVKDLKEVEGSESAMVWGEVSQAILRKEWGRAREAKKAVEKKHRKSLAQREASGQTWTPRHFSVRVGDNSWECRPVGKWVPQAPVIVPC